MAQCTLGADGVVRTRRDTTPGPTPSADWGRPGHYARPKLCGKQNQEATKGRGSPAQRIANSAGRAGAGTRTRFPLILTASLIRMCDNRGASCKHVVAFTRRQCAFVLNLPPTARAVHKCCSICLGDMYLLPHSCRAVLSRAGMCGHRGASCKHVVARTRRQCAFVLMSHPTARAVCCNFCSIWRSDSCLSFTTVVRRCPCLFLL